MNRNLWNGQVDQFRLWVRRHSIILFFLLVALANWQFAASERQRRKIRPWAEAQIDAADLEAGDYLLSWQRGGSGLRYVALLDEGETQRLAGAAGLRVVEQFHSDGREGDLNLYTILAG